MIWKAVGITSVLAGLGISGCAKKNIGLEQEGITLSLAQPIHWKSIPAEYIAGMKECAKPEDKACYCTSEPSEPIKFDIIAARSNHFEVKIKQAPSSNPCLRMFLNQNRYVSGKDIQMDSTTLKNGGRRVRVKKMFFLKTSSDLIANLSPKEKCAIPAGADLYLAGKPGDRLNGHIPITLHPRMLGEVKCIEQLHWWIQIEDLQSLK